MIKAKSVHIGTGSYVSEKADIQINGDFYLGDYSKLGPCEIRGNNISFGDHLYHSKGLVVGGGGHQGPDANLTVGNRCTIHNNFINVCEPVQIGDDVGLSLGVSILTHGYWLNVMNGFPAKFDGVSIRPGVIVGYNSTILPGVKIGMCAVIGANSVVTKRLEGLKIYAGNPAREIGEIESPSEDEQRDMLGKIVAKYKRLAEFQGVDVNLLVDFPYVKVNGFFINVLTLEHEGEESRESDHFRDFMRKFGIRIYTKRPFG